MAHTCKVKIKRLLKQVYINDHPWNHHINKAYKLSEENLLLHTMYIWVDQNSSSITPIYAKIPSLSTYQLLYVSNVAKGVDLIRFFSSISIMLCKRWTSNMSWELDACRISMRRLLSMFSLLSFSTFLSRASMYSFFLRRDSWAEICYGREEDIGLGIRWLVLKRKFEI